jgi:hypothetical protein
VAESRERELLAFALERLPSMRLADGALCHEVEAPGLEPSGRSLRYTLIALLGLLRAREAGLATPVDPAELKALLLRELDSPELTAGDLGLLLWADARSGGEAAAAVRRRLERLSPPRGTPAMEGLEVSWLVLGHLHAGGERDLATALERQLARAQTPSGLFLHTETGRRARFPNFATQIYGVLALAEVARRRDDPAALAGARRAADRLLELQRPNGGWPWILDARGGRVVEPFEVYSVHQDAMAPMALGALSLATADARYEAAARRGLEWVFGRNELGAPMLDREAGIVHRSIRRRRPWDRAALYANAATAALGRPLLARARGPLEVNRTDRPYHLGWVLEAWAGRLA